MLTVDLSSLDIGPGKRVLDLGCGEGRHIHHIYMQKDVLVYGLDLDLDSVKKTHDNCKKYFSLSKSKNENWLIAQGKCEYLPFKRESLDCIICCEVLEHIENYHRAIKEIWWSLKHGGMLVISVPRFLPERICWALADGYKYEKGGHIRIFKESPLKLEVQRLGFKFIKKHYAHGIHSPYWWLKCIKWEKRDTWLPVRLYHRLLVWDIMKSPRLTRSLDKLLTPIIGKSVVLYFKKVDKKW